MAKIILKLIYFFCLCLGLIYLVSAINCPIIAGGSYHIRNKAEDMCISGIYGNGTGAILKGIRELGNLTMNTCKNEPEQEWTFTNVNRNNSGNCTFRISSSKIHYGHIKKNELFMNLTGNIMDYWLSPVHIFENEKMKDMSSGKCFQSNGIALAPVLGNCETNQSLQSWKFLLVNDPNHLIDQI